MTDDPKRRPPSHPAARDLQGITRPADWMFLQPGMLDLMHDAVITTDLHGIVTGCNRAVTSTYGYAHEELIGQSIAILYPEEDRHLLVDTVGPAVLSTGSFHGELRQRTRTGDYIYVHLAITLLRDAEGHPAGMAGFSVDVTAQKLGDIALRQRDRVELELQEQKAASALMKMLVGAVERAEDVILITEAGPVEKPGPRILYVNRAFQKLTGYAPEEVIGQTPRILQGLKTDRRALDRIHNALKSWQPIREELINYRKDGSDFWVDLSIFPIANDHGWYTHWMAIQRDTSEQNRLREQLVEGESRHRFLTESIPELLWTASAQGQCTYVSQSCAAFLGMPESQILGSGWFQCVHPDDVAGTAEKWNEALERGTFFETEYRLRRHDGQYVWFLHRARPRKSEDGRVLEWIGTSSDIALQKRSQEALRQTEKLAAVGRLASSIAHEINNPLTSVTNLLYLLSANSSLDRSAREYVQTAQEELARVSEITTQTLRFHKQSVHAAPARLEDVLDSVLALYRPRLLSSGIWLERQYQRDEPVVCLAADIRQALANIVGNAVEAMPNGGRLWIRKRASCDWKTRQRRGVRITVADSGSGIELEHRGRIFEPFFTTKGITGTGLGLWVTQDLIARHEGSISFRSSTRPGRSGTLMSIFLPFEPTRRV
jgi:PAS domain S-box-containing protein